MRCGLARPPSAGTGATGPAGSAAAYNQTAAGTTTFTGTQASTTYDTTTHYVSASTACVSTSIDTCNVTAAPQTGTVTNGNFVFGANSAGKTWTVQLLVNKVVQGTCSIPSAVS